ncbi:nitroreductase family protein [Aristophania vespae]|uniref:nitroreductase family protein n=1 Tax=Aristophania vespae TaxID=2697033 RepID=UPI0023516CB6|nr:nitroreductase [Aristophania vespae]UMM63721.1 Putative NAD(P)H nitroreductase YdjA [Aristophania vespae]
MHSQSLTASNLDMLLSRMSTDSLQEPAPNGEMLELILATALRAPDHGKLRPWRYIIVEGEARIAFAQEVIAALKRKVPDLPEEKTNKIISRFSAAPALIALGIHLRPNHKIPELEQIMTSAAGAMNILNGLHAQGFGGLWVSGAYCDEPELMHKLGLSSTDQLAGILLVGTPSNDLKKPRRPNIKDYVAYWQEGKIPSFNADKGEKK